MEVGQIKKIAVIGSGNMGTQVAIQCALFGYETQIYARNEHSVKKAQEQIEQHFNVINRSKKIKEEKQIAAKSRLKISVQFSDTVSSADLISENVVEDISIKRETLKQISQYCKPGTIITSNSSTLIPSMFLDVVKEPENFLAFHFHSYVWSSTIVEIMPHLKTSQESVQLLHKFAGKIGQIPLLVKKEHPSYIFNSIMNEINRTALTLVVNGVSTMKEIDLAWRGIMKISVGPFALMDMVGLDTIYHVNEYWIAQTNDEQLKKNSQFLKTYIDAGKLGVKSQQGFYKY